MVAKKKRAKTVKGESKTNTNMKSKKAVAKDKKNVVKKKSTKPPKTPKISKDDIKGEVNKTKKIAKDYASDKNKTAHLIDEALEKAKKNKGMLSEIWDDLMALIRLVKAWVQGKYKDVPWETIIWAIVAIIYFVNPFDLIPDFIPFIGYLDDALVIAWVVRSIKKDLDDFKDWEKI